MISANTRNLEVPSVRSQEINTIFYNAIRVWNSLQPAIRAGRNINTFKKSLKNHIQQKPADGKNSILVHYYSVYNIKLDLSD